MKVDLRKYYAPFEQEEMMLNYLKKHPEGKIVKEISKESRINAIYLNRILKSLVKKKLVRFIKFGHVKLYKVRNNE